MWSHAIADGEPDPDFLRRVNPPENELPVALPENRVLLRTPDLGISLVGMQAYTTGLAFQLVVRAREGAFPEHRLGDIFWERRQGTPQMMLGVEFSDGRRAAEGAFPGPSRDVFLHQ